MKKLLSLVLALALALPLSVTAFATETNNNTFGPSDTDGKATTVNYSVAPAYTVTIPTSVTIDSTNKSGTATVSASGVKVAKGKQVEVKLTGINESTAAGGNTTSDTTFTVKTAEGASLTYTVQKGSNTINKGDTVLAVKSGLNNEKDASGNDKNTGASTGSADLTFALATDAVVEYAGTYTGTVTFTVSVENVPDNTTP